MESYSYTLSSSSSIYQPTYTQQEDNAKPQPPMSTFHSSFPSIHKSPKKIMKHHIAPLPPTPPKIYQVDSANFKQVVQKLTGAPPLPPRRLQQVAPPPLNLSTRTLLSENDVKGATHLQPVPSPCKTPLSATFRDLMNDTLDQKSWKLSDSFGTLSPLWFSMSPASLAWCSSFLMSPGTPSTSLQHGTVL